MKIYIFWEGIRNKENNNIVESEDVIDINDELKANLSTMFNKSLTKDTKIFGVI